MPPSPSGSSILYLPSMSSPGCTKPYSNRGVRAPAESSSNVADLRRRRPGATFAPMHRLGLAALVVAALATASGAEDLDDESARADKGTFGLGLILGEPTGISAKLYLQDDQAIQAAVG